MVDKYIVVAFGVKGIDGENHIKPAVIPSYWFDKENNKLNFSFEDLNKWSTIGGGIIVNEITVDGILEQLAALKGHPVLFGFASKFSDSEIEEAIKYAGEEYRPYLKDLTDRCNLAEALLAEMYQNDQVLSEKSRYLVETKLEVPDIDSLDDLSRIDISKIPCILGISSDLVIN